MKLLLALLLAATPAFAAKPAPKTPIHKLDIWGTCYFQFSCQGSPIGLGKTASECREQGGHSLFAPNVNRCFNI